MATQVSDQLSCEWRPYLYEIICGYTKRERLFENATNPIKLHTNRKMQVAFRQD